MEKGALVRASGLKRLSSHSVRSLTGWLRWVHGSSLPSFCHFPPASRASVSAQSSSTCLYNPSHSEPPPCRPLFPCDPTVLGDYNFQLWAETVPTPTMGSADLEHQAQLSSLRLKPLLVYLGSTGGKKKKKPVQTDLDLVTFSTKPALPLTTPPSGTDSTVFPPADARQPRTHPPFLLLPRLSRLAHHQASASGLFGISGTRRLISTTAQVKPPRTSPGLHSRGASDLGSWPPASLLCLLSPGLPPEGSRK